MAELSDHQDSEHFTYDRSWEEIETMLDKAERRMNMLISTFHAAKERYDERGSQKDYRAMRDAARNKKALEGVVKTLRWVLGDKNVMHPLE